MSGIVRFSQQASVLQRVVGDEVLIATVHSSEISSLRGTAAQQWLMLDRPHTMAELVSGLAELYHVASGSIQSDVGFLLDELLMRGLVEEGSDDD